MDVRRLALLFGRSTCLFLSATLIASVSMLSADEASWSFSRNIFYRVFAPTYPGPQDRSATVVLLNDASFQAFDTYPVKYQTHATILRALATYSPRAVFVDFAFIDDRPDQTIDDLKSVLEEYYNRHIPIYFPVHKVSNSPNDKGIRPDLAELANAGRINLVSFELGRTLWDSPLYSLYSKREGRPTIGAQIMKDFYSQLYSTNIAGKSEFEIWWGLPPAQINCDRVGDPCGWRYNIFGRLLDAINLKFMPLDWEIGADPVRIPYSPLIYVDDLLNGNKRDTITPALTSKFVLRTRY
jgi:hypothetical protein